MWTPTSYKPHATRDFVYEQLFKAMIGFTVCILSFSLFIGLIAHYALLGQSVH